MGILIANTGEVCYAKRHTASWLVVLCAVLTLSARADITDFRVNDDSGNAEQNHPRVAVAADGSFVIAWVDRRSSSADIYLQRYLADGTKVGGNQLINDDTGDAYQSEPGLAADHSGEFGLVWKDYRDGAYPFDPNIYFQKLDTSIAATGANSSLTGHQTEQLKETPDIAFSAWDGGMVVWADYRNQNWDIYGQLIAGDGSTSGLSFRVNDDTGVSQQHAPRVAVSPEGWYVVAWYDNRDGSDDIYVQRFDSLANALGTNVRVNSDTAAARQAFPDVATDGAGHFTVVWVDWRNGVYPANPDIYARKFDTTMTPLAAETLLNTDGSLRAQREPTIAADRRGNVAIIWSDSTGTAHLFDIRGQMIDVDGVIRELNFTANGDADSTQLHADVAVDGLYRYVTWADKRNGNFDIYASVTKYNDPTLVPSATALRFEMLEGEAVPAAQSLTIDHAGYNPIRFELQTSDSWFAVSPSSGTTEATVDVSITTDALPHGTYIGAITLIDTDNNDSTVDVAVRLDVTVPILEVTPKTMAFEVFAGVPDSTSQILTIANIGSGYLNWTIVEDADWLRPAEVNGLDDDQIALWVNGATLSAGSDTAFLEIVADGAVGSPDTVTVTVESVDNQPYIHLSEETIWIATEDPAAFGQYLRVENYGAGTLAWTAEAGDTWLQIDRLAGSDDDSIGLSIDPAGLSFGRYETYIDVTDSAAYHPVERVGLILEYLSPSEDTVLINSVQSEVESIDSVLIELALVGTAVEIYMPLTYDPILIRPDSARTADTWPVLTSCAVTVDSTRGVLELSALTSGGAVVSNGSYDFAWLYYTTLSAVGRTTLAEPLAQGRAIIIVNPDGARRNPISYPGEIQVSGTTGIEDWEQTLPSEFALRQNYPNPFNPSTTIEFSLSTRADATLEVFNILGQNIRVLLEESLPAGPHNVLWDGRFSDGRPAPSGIYFYRLRVPERSLVRKMVLVK